MVDLYEDQVKTQVQELVSQIKRIEDDGMRDRLTGFALDNLQTVKSGDSFGSTTSPATPVSTVGYTSSDPHVGPGQSRTEHIDKAMAPTVATTPPSPVTAQPNKAPEEQSIQPKPPAEEPQSPPEAPAVEQPKVVPVIEPLKAAPQHKADTTKK